MISDLLTYIFDGLDCEVSVFDSEGDSELSTTSLSEASEFFENCTAPGVSLLTSSGLVGVTGSHLDASLATFVMERGEARFAVFLFEDPVAESSVPAHYEVEIPAAENGWTLRDVTGRFYTLEEVEEIGNAPSVHDHDDVAPVRGADDAVLEPASVAGDVSQNDTVSNDDKDPAAADVPTGVLGVAGSTDGSGEGVDASSDEGVGGGDAGRGDGGRMVGGPDDAEPADLSVHGAARGGDAREAGAEGAPGGAAEKAGTGVAPKVFNDAELIGVETPAFVEFLKRDAVFMHGKLYGAKDRRNTQDGDWEAVTHTWGEWIVSVFSKHPLVKEKEGTSVVFGESVEGARTAKSMKTMHAMALDIDSGAKLDDVLSKIADLGLLALIYTSHSHGKSGLEVKRDEVIRKLNLTAAPTLAQVKEYLREHEKSRMEPAFIDAVEIEDDARQTKQGVQIVLRTPPLDKFRVVFPLAEPVEIAGLDVSHAKALDVWENKVTGLASKILGVHFDTACTDPSRLFYLPRHPKDGVWYAAIVRGDALRFEDVPEVSKQTYAKARGGMNPFVEAGLEEDADKVPEAYTPAGRSLREWHRRAKGRYEMADMLDAMCPERVRVSGGEKHGTVHIECPFEHEHTKEGGTGTWAGNASDSSSEYWFIQCHHDACQGRHKLEFLAQMLEDRWFEEDVLTDPAYLMPGDEDDAEEEVAGDADDTPSDTTPSPLQRAEALDKDASEEDVRVLLAELHAGGVDRVERNAVTKAIAKNTYLTASDVKAIWKELDKEKDKAARLKASEDVEGFDGFPMVDEWDFKQMCDYGQNRLLRINAREPSLFLHMDEVATVREDEKGRARIKHLNEKQFAVFLNNATTWHKRLGEDGSRGVSAPNDIVSHLYSSPYGCYPPLRGVVSSPCFSPDGELINEPGFHHASGLYYMPPADLVLPRVSSKPSADEVREARRLLVEEVLADFPLGGLGRDEILSGSLCDGEGVPAVTNMVGLILLPFIREMISGATPGHLLTKPTPATGASLLTECFSLLTVGEEGAAQSMPSSKEEMEKTLLTLLSDGSRIVYFDNINDSVDSGVLASALTAPTFKGRMLGRTQTVETDVQVAWVFTGNNVTLSGELVRRLCMVDLDARVSRPENRSNFRHSDLKGWIRANRGKLVWACLTLVQNWIALGSPSCSEQRMASYDNWARIVGSILKVSGLNGFLGNAQALRETATDDAGEDAVIHLIHCWWETAGKRPIPVQAMSDSEMSVCSIAESRDIPLPVKMRMSTDGDRTYCSRSMTSLLTKYRRRVFEMEDGISLRIEPGKKVKNALTYYLSPQNTVSGNAG